MKITKRQLRKIIAEEKQRLVEMQSPIRRQAMILSDLDSAIKNVEETADNLYGLEDPGDPGMGAGDEMAEELKGAIAMLNNAYRRIEAYFEDID